MILRLSDIKINSDFENRLPAPSMEQFKQLEENMVKEGRARNPLVIWKGRDILLDGHNRLRILKAHPELGWTFIDQECADEEEAKEWIIKNALGTRNLTEPQYKLLVAELYKGRKKKRGNNAARGEGGKYLCTQNGNTGDEPRRVSEQLAKELGVAKNTVIRAEQYADGLEAAEAVIPGTKERATSGELKAQDGEIRSWRKKTPEEIKESVAEIEERNSKKRKPHEKSFSASLKALDATMSGVSTPSYTMHDLLTELDVITDEFVKKFMRTVEVRKDVIESYTDGAELILSAADKAIEKIKNMKGNIKNG